jgi:hypothetical protein
MAMGRRKDVQGELLIYPAELPDGGGHVFYEKLNQVLARYELTARLKHSVSSTIPIRSEAAGLRFLRASTSACASSVMHTAAGNVPAIESDLTRLKAVRARCSPEIAPQCTEYLNDKAAKAATERLRDQAKVALGQYRASVFPLYQNAINDYLRRFYASFRLGSVEAADTRGGPTCNYSVVISETSVAIAGTATAPGTPSFRTTLSSGDRNTLALALFFSSLDQDPALADMIDVIDDPITSLGDHRSLTTVQEIRRLVQRTRQVIVLSHSKPLLCRLGNRLIAQQASTLPSIGASRPNNRHCNTGHPRRSRLHSLTLGH